MATYAPRHVDIWPWTKWKAHTLDSVTRTNHTGYLGMGYLQHTAAGTGCYVTYDVALDAGTWTLTWIRGSGPAGGIVTVSLGGVDLAPTVDTYSAGGTANLVSQWTGITVATAGVYELKLRTDSKHASSTGYNFASALYALTRTGA